MPFPCQCHLVKAKDAGLSPEEQVALAFKAAAAAAKSAGKSVDEQIKLASDAAFALEP